MSHRLAESKGKISGRLGASKDSRARNRHVTAGDLLYSVIFAIRETNGCAFWNKESLLLEPGIRSSAAVIAELELPSRKAAYGSDRG